MITKRFWLVSVFAFGLGPAPATNGLAQVPEDWERFVAVKGWTGTFSLQGESVKVTENEVRYTLRHSANGTVKLDRVDQGSGLWRGRMEANVSVFEERYVLRQGRVDESWVGSVTATNGARNVGAALMLDTLSDLRIGYSFFVDATLPVTYTWYPNRSRTIPDYGWGVRSYPAFPFSLGTAMGLPSIQVELPASGLELSGSIQFVDADYFYPAKWTASWRLTPDVEEEVELIISSTDSYRDWRPQAGQDEDTEGNRLTLTASLRKKGGGPTARKASKITFQLLDVSAEPGVAINWPPQGKAKGGRDLKFLKSNNGAPINPGSLTDSFAETLDGSYTRADITVSAFDWGAHGRLRVTALVGGRTISGFLEDDPAQVEVRLPKSTPFSVIHEKWKTGRGLAARPDNDDDEIDPKGDLDEYGHKGDGLTLYEEYRGFYENGKHLEGDPKKKDFFVRDVTGRHPAGISAFSRLTGLVVHGKLKAGELAPDNQINFNHGSNLLHLVDQHGVAIVVAQADVARATRLLDDDHLGTPGGYRFVQVPPTWSQWIGQPYASMPYVIAHELLHTVSVYHHGDSDFRMDLSLDSSGNEPVIRGHLRRLNETKEMKLEIRTEEGATVPFENLPHRNLKVGEFGGQHSGVWDCVMRYACASGYIRPTGADTGVFYWTHDEADGTALCDSKVGTGQNDPGLPYPKPRYGDASGSSGRCRNQICVNDLYGTHPWRVK